MAEVAAVKVECPEALYSDDDEENDSETLEVKMSETDDQATVSDQGPKTKQPRQALQVDLGDGLQLVQAPVGSARALSSTIINGPDGRRQMITLLRHDGVRINVELPTTLGQLPPKLGVTSIILADGSCTTDPAHQLEGNLLKHVHPDDAVLQRLVQQQQTTDKRKMARDLKQQKASIQKRLDEIAHSRQQEKQDRDARFAADQKKRLLDHQSKQPQEQEKNDQLTQSMLMARRREREELNRLREEKDALLLMEEKQRKQNRTLPTALKTLSAPPSASAAAVRSASPLPRPSPVPSASASTHMPLADEPPAQEPLTSHLSRRARRKLLQQQREHEVRKRQVELQTRVSEPRADLPAVPLRRESVEAEEKPEARPTAPAHSRPMKNRKKAVLSLDAFLAMPDPAEPPRPRPVVATVPAETAGSSSVGACDEVWRLAMRGSGLDPKHHRCVMHVKTWAKLTAQVVFVNVQSGVANDVLLDWVAQVMKAKRQPYTLTAVEWVYSKTGDQGKCCLLTFGDKTQASVALIGFQQPDTWSTPEGCAHPTVQYVQCVV